MDAETLLLLLLVVILVEYSLRLRRSVDQKAEVKFQRMKEEYLKSLGAKCEEPPEKKDVEPEKQA
jgi:hypothetical protein